MSDPIHLTPNTYYQIPITCYLLPVSDPRRATKQNTLSKIEWQKKWANSRKWADLDDSRPPSDYLHTCRRRGYHVGDLAGPSDLATTLCEKMAGYFTG
jgi:hypothetical protein